MWLLRGQRSGEITIRLNWGFIVTPLFCCTQTVAVQGVLRLDSLPANVFENTRLNQVFCYTQTHRHKQTETYKAANFTPTLLRPCLGTAVKHRQRDRWYRAGRRGFCCPLCTHVSVRICKRCVYLMNLFD